MPCAPASTNRAGQSWLQAGHPVITPRDVEANATQTGRSVVTGSSAYADDDDREYGNRLKLARMTPALSRKGRGSPPNLPRALPPTTGMTGSGRCTMFARMHVPARKR
jgi:hypothetical protein